MLNIRAPLILIVIHKLVFFLFSFFLGKVGSDMGPTLVGNYTYINGYKKKLLINSFISSTLKPKSEAPSTIKSDFQGIAKWLNIQKIRRICPWFSRANPSLTWQTTSWDIWNTMMCYPWGQWSHRHSPVAAKGWLARHGRSLSWLVWRRKRCQVPRWSTSKYQWEKCLRSAIVISFAPRNAWF